MTPDRPTLAAAEPRPETSRREVAFERGIDAMADLLEWRGPTKTPAKPDFYRTRANLDKPGVTSVLFTGRFWMADEPVMAWRPESPADADHYIFRPIGKLAVRAQLTGGGPEAQLRAVGQPARRGQLLPAGTTAPKEPVKKASSFDELSLVPMDGPSNEERSSIERLASLELRVEVVKFSKPAQDASGLSTGKVLAVSENYSAQRVGANHVVIHENKALDRQVSPGDRVTMAYEGGKATVYDGLTHDINIGADWMPAEQRGYLRRVMLDALSMMDAPQSEEEKLRDAMRYALESAANYFGLSETKLRRADISLVVNDRTTAIPKAAATPQAEAWRGGALGSVAFGGEGGLSPTTGGFKSAKAMDDEFMRQTSSAPARPVRRP